MRSVLPELLLAVLGLGLVYSTWRQESNRPRVLAVAGALLVSTALQLLSYRQATSFTWQAAEITWGIVVILKLSVLVVAAILGKAQAKARASVALALIILIVLLTILTTLWATLMLVVNFIYSHGG